MTPRTRRGSASAKLLISWVLVDTLFGALWLAGALFVFSNASTNALLFLILFLFGLVLGMLWMARTIVVIGSRVTGNRVRMTLWFLILWCLVPLFGAAGVALSMTDWDLRLRVKLSEDALLAEARSVRAEGERYTERPSRWIGLFYVEHIYLLDDGAVRFTTDHPWLFDEGGLYHTLTPDPKPFDEGGIDELRDLYGPWRAFYYFE